MNLNSFKHENVCLFVCSCFLGHFEPDWETIWHKAAFCFLECPKIFLKCVFFCKELLHLFYISLIFLCKLKSDYRKNKGGRNLILFAKELAGYRKKITGNFFPKTCQFFVVPVYVKSSFIAKSVMYTSNIFQFFYVKIELFNRKTFLVTSRI